MTGKMWAYQHFGIVPDMICFGKKTQVCGFCSTERIDTAEKNVFNVQSRINSTWGGNIVDMVRFTIINEIIKEEKLVDNARKVGKYLLEKLQELPLENVRGKGLMIAFDLEDREARNKFLDKAKKKMTLLPCGERSIRLRPSLVINKEEANLIYEFLKEIS
jgi:L-lysine 6-transaminase